MAGNRLFIAVTLAALAATIAPARAEDGADCVAAGTSVERSLQLPPGLLLAIGLVESGRRDAATGRVLPWPWSIDAAGRDEIFADPQAAAARTRALQSQGVASIDVGCFQINLAAHPGAFATIEQGFEPQANARAAGLLLVALHDQTGSWEQAIAYYHSATPALGGPYRDRVMAAWGHATDAVSVAAMAPPAAPAGLQVMQWAPVCCGVHVWTPASQPAAHVITLAPMTGLPQIRVAAR